MQQEAKEFHSLAVEAVGTGGGCGDGGLSSLFLPRSQLKKKLREWLKEKEDESKKVWKHC